MKPPKPPAHLSEEAAARWTRVLGEYDLEAAALLVLEAALEAFDRMRQAQKVLAAEGLIVHDRFGRPKAHRAAIVERDSRGAMLALSSRSALIWSPYTTAPVGRQVSSRRRSAAGQRCQQGKPAPVGRERGEGFKQHQ